MPNLSIKDVPESWAEALRQRAIRNHRSLQGELMALVEAAVAPLASSPASPTPLTQAFPAWADVAALPRGQERGAAPAAPGKKTIQQVMADLRTRYPEGVAGAPLGRDIIRAERDAR